MDLLGLWLVSEPDNRRGAVFEEDGAWWYMDEGYEKQGPYNNESAAREALDTWLTGLMEYLHKLQFLEDDQ